MVLWWAYARPLRVLFLSSSFGVWYRFNSSTGAITNNSQSSKDLDPYFKSQLYVEDIGYRKLVLILQNGLSKPGKRAYDGNSILPWLAFELPTS